jgi:hypothetical protein
VLTVVLAIHYRATFFPAEDRGAPDAPATEDFEEVFAPYPDYASLEINPIIDLNRLDKEAIGDIRYALVMKNAFLNLFPEDYDPLQPPRDKIFERIASGKGWIADSQFHVCNPYLLIIPTCRRRINPIMTNGGDLYVTLTYTGTSIEERYELDDAQAWLGRAFACPDRPGEIRLWMTNAYDAGFPYASLDFHMSENVDLGWGTGGNTIVGGLHSQSGFFHVGNHGQNNLSPADAKGRIRLREADTATSIYVKLWRARPVDADAPQDFAYHIVLLP